MWEGLWFREKGKVDLRLLFNSACGLRDEALEFQGPFLGLTEVDYRVGKRVMRQTSGLPNRIRLGGRLFFSRFMFDLKVVLVRI